MPGRGVYASRSPTVSPVTDRIVGLAVRRTRSRRPGGFPTRGRQVEHPIGPGHPTYRSPIAFRSVKPFPIGAGICGGFLAAGGGRSSVY